MKLDGLLLMVESFHGVWALRGWSGNKLEPGILDKHEVGAGLYEWATKNHT